MRGSSAAPSSVSRTIWCVPERLAAIEKKASAGSAISSSSLPMASRRASGTASSLEALGAAPRASSPPATSGDAPPLSAASPPSTSSGADEVPAEMKAMGLGALAGGLALNTPWLRGGEAGPPAGGGGGDGY